MSLLPHRHATQTTRVMIVDDTITYRAILKETLSDIPHAEATVTARNGQEALEKLAVEPVDLVLLDVEMPIMDGMATLLELKRRSPNTAVVMVSGVDPNSANITFRALEAGALDFVAKPSGGTAHSNIAQLREKLTPIIQHLREENASSTKQPSLSERTHTSLPQPAPMVPPVSAFQPKGGLSQLRRAQTTLFTPKVLAIGISTGGPNALKAVLPQLPPDLGLPVVVVIHMPEKFTAYLADSLNRACALHVKEVTNGEPMLPNTVYIAAGGHHMEAHRGEKLVSPPTLHITDAPPENNCRPAVDVLFRSLPAIYPKGILSVIMTGMGNDGLAGVRTIRDHVGHYTLTQSAESCTVYGMPKAIDDAQCSDESVPLNDLATRILQLCHKG